MAELQGVPGGRETILRTLLSNGGFALSEMVTCGLQQPHSLVDWRVKYDTKVPGEVGPPDYVLDLDAIGFSSNAEFGVNTVITAEIYDGANTHKVTISKVDGFSSASSGGNFTLNGGACSINRANGDLTIVTQAATDDLSAGVWRLSAYIEEPGSEMNVGLAEMHGRDSRPGGNAEAKWDAGRSQLVLPPSAGLSSEVIYTQALFAGAGLTWPTTAGGFMVAALVAPYKHWASSMQMSYSISDDPTLIPSTLVAITKETAIDLLGDTWAFWSLAMALAGSPQYLTLAFDFSAGAARTSPTFFQGFAVGSK